jgi:hypothetical protein
MFDPTQAAYTHGEKTALGAFGLTKAAFVKPPNGVLGTLARGAGKVLGVGGKVIGGTGVGAPVGAALSGGGALINSMANGENMQTGLARAGAAAATSMIPGVIPGMIAGEVADRGITAMSQPKPAPTGMTNYARGPATAPMPGMAGQGHLPGMVSY